VSTTSWDASELAASRICGAHVGKPKFLAEVQARAQTWKDIQVQFRKLYTLYDIDASTEDRLDRIGALIGQPRRLENAVPQSFFGFAYEGAGYAHPMPFGGDPSVKGERFWDSGTALGSSIDMPDALYRRAIRARIVRNSIRPSTGTGPLDAIYACLFEILPDYKDITLTVQHAGDMSLTISVGRALTPEEMSLILYAGILPIPAAVGWHLTTWNATAKVFGFNDTISLHGAGVGGFGERGDEDAGAIFAERAR
jgi:hypothetical protein